MSPVYQVDQKSQGMSNVGIESRLTSCLSSDSAYRAFSRAFFSSSNKVNISYTPPGMCITRVLTRITYILKAQISAMLKCTHSDQTGPCSVGRGVVQT